MKLATILEAGERRAALVEGRRVGIDRRTGGLDAVLADDGVVRPDHVVAIDEVQFDAPLRPPVVFCVGQNYLDHLEEKAAVHRPEPEFFLKAGQTIARPGRPAVLDPRVTRKMDYETELGIVIGRAGHAITEAEALSYVFGYVAINDLTARDRQVVVHPDGTQSMALGPGKNFDGSTRMGAYVVTSDEVEDPADLELRTIINGEIRQLNTTRNLISTLPEIIAFVSRMVTLQPGSIISTGTPGGTGWGMDPELGGTGMVPQGCSPARYLLPGDSVEGTIGPVSYAFTVEGA